MSVQTLYEFTEIKAINYVGIGKAVCVQDFALNVREASDIFS
jgi:hypothetical protein